MKKFGIICAIITGIIGIVTAVLYFITKREIDNIFSPLDDVWDCDECNDCLKDREE